MKSKSVIELLQEPATQADRLGKLIDLLDGFLSIDLSGIELSLMALKDLCLVIEVNNSLHSINLSRNKITDQGAAFIAKAVKKNYSLHKLDLRDNNIGDDGAADIEEALVINDSLYSLYLSGNKIGAKNAEFLGAAFTLPLKSVSYIDACLGSTALAALELHCKRNRQMVAVPLALLASILYFGADADSVSLTKSGFAGGVPRDLAIFLLMRASPAPDQKYAVKLLSWLDNHPPTFTLEKRNSSSLSRNEAGCCIAC